MPLILDSTTGRRRLFRGRPAPAPAPAPVVPAEPLGYDVEARMLDDLFRSGRMTRPSYELARRQLQKTYGVGRLPESSTREA